MTSIIEQRATELAAERQQQALAAFENEYKELLEPIRGSGLTYHVVTLYSNLQLIFTLAATGDTISLPLDYGGQVSSRTLSELTPNQLTEVLAEQLLSWEKLKEMRQWEQRVKFVSFIGNSWIGLSTLTIVMALLCLSIVFMFKDSVPDSLICAFLGCVIATLIALLLHDWYRERRKAYLTSIWQSSPETLGY